MYISMASDTINRGVLLKALQVSDSQDDIISIKEKGGGDKKSKTK